MTNDQQPPAYAMEAALEIDALPCDFVTNESNEIAKTVARIIHHHAQAHYAGEVKRLREAAWGLVSLCEMNFGQEFASLNNAFNPPTASALQEALIGLRQALALSPAPAEVEAVSHPRQPIIVAKDGVTRFKANAIVRFLLDWSTSRGMGMNELLMMDKQFSNEDRSQLAQLIGYSVSGFGELDYASPDEVAACDASAAKLGKEGA